jgi:tRNA (guanine26-N2/guanine27-N2)-dimethyltransferase
MANSTNLFKKAPKGYKMLKEGSARFLYPSQSKDVHYNPAQQFNRDISVLAINQFAKQHKGSLNVLEALAGTGLSSLRYMNEVS